MFMEKSKNHGRVQCWKEFLVVRVYLGKVSYVVFSGAICLGNGASYVLKIRCY